MGDELSLDSLPRLRAASPRTGIVVLTMQNDPAFARRALAEGAEGYVLKEAPRAQLVLAIRTVAGGGTYLPAGISARALAAPEEDDPLTERERTVLRLLALGHTNAEIAAQLYVSARTVETHRASVQRKLGANGRPDLVRYAIARGMLDQ
jgi:two-component system response regulator NreC